jgi:DNA repair protein RadC
MNTVAEYGLTMSADGKPTATALNNKFPKVQLKNADDVQKYIRQFWGTDINFIESSVAVYMDNNNKVLGWAKISTGGIDCCIVDIRVIMKYAIDLLATGIILAHNHPSGKLTPSNIDDRLTTDLKNACDIMRFQLLDHVIIAPNDNEFYSYRESGHILY